MTDFTDYKRYDKMVLLFLSEIMEWILPIATCFTGENLLYSHTDIPGIEGGIWCSNYMYYYFTIFQTY